MAGEVAVRFTVGGADKVQAAFTQIGQQGERVGRTLSQSASQARSAFTGLTSGLSITTGAAADLGLISNDTAGKVLTMTSSLQAAAAAAGILRGALTVMLGPIGLAVAAITLLGVAVFKIVQHFREKAKAAREAEEALVRYEARASQTAGRSPRWHTSSVRAR